MRLIFFSVALISLSSSTAFGQVTAGDCNTAINICSNAGFSIDPNGFGLIDELGDGFTTGLISNPASNPNIIAATGIPNMGCLQSGELNSTWMIVNIASTGALEFSFGTDGGANCYDWIMWQYSPTTCTDIQANLVPPVACNWNGACEGYTGMAGGPFGSGLPAGGDQSNFEDALSVTCGEQYLICFSNFSSALTSVPLNFFGSATISCTTYNPVAVTDTTICEGQCVDLIANGGLTYSWVANPDLSSTTGATVTACPLGSGVYDYYVTGTGACGVGVDTATVTVTAIGNPTITPPGPLTPLDPAFNMVGATAGGVWSSNCGACIDPITGLFDPAIAGTGTWQICYVIGTPPCDSMDCIDVTVGCITPILDPVAAITVCDSLVLPVITGVYLSGNQAYYTGVGGTGTQYFAGNVITSSVNLYVYDQAGVGCTDEEAGLNILVQFSPNAGVDSTLILCNTASTVDLNTLLTGGIGGTWLETTAPSSGQFNSTTGVFNPASLAGINYTFSYTSTGVAPCIDDVANFTVVIVSGNPNLSCPGTINTSCSILEEAPYADLASFLAAGGTATDPSNILDINSLVLLSEVSDGLSCPETVTRTYQISNACGLSDQCVQTIVVNDLILPTASNPATVNVNCPDDVPAPNVNDVTDAADNCSNPAVFHISDVSDGNVCNDETITRTYRVSDACGNTVDVVQNIVIDAVINSIDAGADLTVCDGELVTLSAVVSGVATVTWSHGVIDGQAFIPPVGITSYVATANVCTGLCVSMDTMTIEVIAVPAVAFMADTLSGCEPLLVTFTNLSVPGGVDCLWTFGNGNTTLGCGTVSNLYGGAGSYDVSLMVTDINGCSSTETYVSYINVFDNPTASFTANPFVIDVNNTLVHFTNTTIGGSTYTWDFGDSTALSFEENPEHVFPPNPGIDYPVTLYAVSDMGCIDSLIRYIIVNEVIIYYVPNSFTPDGDEFNNVFKPIFTTGYDPYDFTMLIYNRWGEVIFESHDSDFGWDGTYGSDRLVKQGVYVWTIEFKETMSDKRHKINGHVSILR
ncbi:MAG: gliding motility-associated-like protein [Flavobacteriaceae bacterium]|jgi:gliding motility-associated-like protein